MPDWTTVEVESHSSAGPMQRYGRLPVRTHVITEGDDIVELADRATADLREPGDIIVVSESVVATAQGRAIPADQIHPGLLARILWRFVRKVPYGTGLRSPLSMQCAIEEVGAGRIILASLAGGLGKLIGRRGDFYRVAGMQAALIDAAYTSGVRQFHDCVILGPKDPEGAARAIAERTGVEAAIMDINDIGGSWVIGASDGVNRPLLEEVMRDNPLGQGDEQTPIGIVRRLPPCEPGPAADDGADRKPGRADDRALCRAVAGAPMVAALALACALIAGLLGARVCFAQPPVEGELPVRPGAASPASPPAGKPGGPAAAEDTEAAKRRDQANRLVERARDANRAGDWRRAVELLGQASGIDPSYSQPFRWLGFIYEQQYHRATKPEDARALQRAAIGAYAEALAIKPDAEFAAPHIARLFFAGEFPTVLDAAALSHVPPRFVVGSCLLVPPGAPDSRPVRGGYAYTVSTIYPPEAPEATGVDVWPTSPKGARQAFSNSAESRERFNRVSYGYTLQPREETYVLKFALHYTSPALQERSIPAAPLAAKVMNALLHFYWYTVVYLGVQPVDVSEVWLSETAAPGGEQSGADILLNDIATPREPIEWVREVAHEYGHLVLPPIGHFTDPDDTGSGVLGERLLLAWLAVELERVANAPWPAQAAQSAANAFWGGEKLDIQTFVANHCDEPLVFWLLQGPTSDLVSQTSREGLAWLTGLALYIEAAHGAHVLGQAFRDTEGDESRDFLRGCEKAIARALDDGELRLNPRVFIPGASRTNTPVFRRLGPAGDLRLPTDGRATYWLYLPAGSWAVSLSAKADGDVTFGVSLDAATPTGLVLREGATSPGEVVLRNDNAGWRQLTISVANADAEVSLRDIVLRRAP